MGNHSCTTHIHPIYFDRIVSPVLVIKMHGIKLKNPPSGGCRTIPNRTHDPRFSTCFIKPERALGIVVGEQDEKPRA